MSNRREKFREYMSLLDAAADPRLAIERGFYVQMPGRGTAEQIAGRLELRPASTHLVVGGVGAGKTTQLLVANDRLTELGDTLAIYIDVSKHQDLRKLQPGVLLTLAGLDLSRLLDEESDLRPKIENRFLLWANGYEEDPFAYDEAPGPWVGGVVTSPSHDLEFDVARMKSSLGELREALATQCPNLVFIIDSLDRLSTLAPLSKLLEQDIAAISALGIGLVLVGPIQAIHGLQRLTAERFDYVYHQAFLDVQQDPHGRDFLFQVLRQRAPESLISAELCMQLVRYSGGALRDLISLARQAVEEAYLDGADTVNSGHVLTAADALGRSLMIGLRPAELNVLQLVREQGSFVMTSEDDLALLATRRILEYRSPGVRYTVHPTIEPLLKQLTGGK
ncbi:hypothetical protein I3V78_37200 [Archangium primigenium]|nr:hypothetical protein [Archangium primigenium]